ncbi:MAG: hypothetical protein JXR73_08415 [Candidatus Omnitrophica bacterium]|nr:hypothetical protein [Candidatus Omnitrophota bacterium]
MNIQNYPIFRKDFSVQFKLMLAALIMQGMIMFLYPPLIRMMDSRLGPIYDWFPPVQQAIAVLVGLIAAGYWYAEERAGNNLCFLQRLPATSRRIWGEKTAAGIAALTAFLVIQTLWSLIIYTESASFMSANGVFFLGSIFTISLFAYGIGLPLSRYMKQTISVILVGIPVVVLLGILLIMSGVLMLVFIEQTFYWKRYETYYAYHLHFMITVAPIVLIMGLFLLRQSIFKPRTAFDHLATIFFAQNRLYQYLALGALIFIPFRFVYYEAGFMRDLNPFLMLACATVSILIGVNTYSNDEKHGLRNVLYHHPASLSSIYWSRWICGFILAMIPALCFMYYGLINSQVSFASNLEMNPVPIFVNLYLIGLLPFACAAFITHAIRNTLYAVFESIAAVLIVTFICIQSNFNTFINFPQPILSNAFNQTLLNYFSWLPSAMLIGFALAGWRAATDRKLLTGGTLYRQIYIGRLFIFLLAVLLIAFKTGWKDLLFLTTGVDAGMG